MKGGMETKGVSLYLSVVRGGFIRTIT